MILNPTLIEDRRIGISMALGWRGVQLRKQRGLAIQETGEIETVICSQENRVSQI
jgi:hypothetical protein